MSHAIDMSNARANMAYAAGTETPWHKLGSTINADASIEEWQQAAGLTFHIEQGDLVMRTKSGKLVDAKELSRHVLYRDDTLAPLSVVSGRYHVVQPKEVLEFFRDLVGAGGFKMNTAGSLHGGKKIWALAEIGEEAEILSGDRVQGYLLLATACDGTLATTAKFTSVRVVCQNTPHMATERGAKGGAEVKVPHFLKFDAKAAKKELGIASAVWGSFVESARLLAKVKLDEKKASSILRKVYDKTAANETQAAIVDAAATKLASM